MKKLTFGLALIGIFGLLFQSCKKEKPSTYYIPVSLKQYAVFQPGSYWIYKNEVTGKSDSNYISQPPVFLFYQGSPEYGLIEEEAMIYYHGAIFQSGSIRYNYYHLAFNSHSTNAAIYAGSYEPGYKIHEASGATISNLAMLDTVAINGITYHGVFVTEWKEILVSKDTLRDVSYFVKGVGLVKIEQHLGGTDTTWTLLRSHTVQ